MRNVNLKPFVIFAINSDMDSRAEQDLIGAFLGKSVKKLTGCYNGKTEHSYLVVLDNEEDLILVRDLAAIYNQESILYVDNEREAKLHYLSQPSQKRLGRWSNVSAPVAISSDCYTFDPATGRYYVTIPHGAM